MTTSIQKAVKHERSQSAHAKKFEIAIAVQRKTADGLALANAKLNQ